MTKHIFWGIGSAPYHVLYRKDGESLTKLPSLAEVFMNPSLFCIAFSHSGEYLAVRGGASPWIYLYKISGDVFTRLTLNVPDIALPTSSISSLAWSPDDSYLAIGIDSTAGNRVYIYKLVGDQLLKVATPTISSGQCKQLAWSPDGKHLAIALGLQNAPIWKRNLDDSFTELGSISTVGAAVAAHSLAYSPDGKYIALGTNQTYGPYIFGVLADTYSLVQTIAGPTLMASANGLSWSLDGKHLLSSKTTAPYIIVWRLSGGIFTELASPIDGVIGATINSMVWSDDGIFLYAGLAAAPYLCALRRVADTYVVQPPPANIMPTSVLRSGDSSPHINQVSTFAPISGHVFDQNGNPISRTVRSYMHSSGRFIDEAVSDPTTGEFQLWSYNASEHYVIVVDPDKNALIYDHVIPTA